MTPEEKDAIRDRCEKATPGPWRWTHREWDERYFSDRKTRDGRRIARKGENRRRSWVYLLQGPVQACVKHFLGGLSIPEIIQRDMGNELDFQNVFGLRWEQIKGDSLCGPAAAIREPDMAFIAHARTDVEQLLFALDAAEARIHELEHPGEV